MNTNEGKLIPKRRATLIDDLELVGLNYCWKVVLCSNQEVSNKAIDLLTETFTNLGPRLVAQVEIHEDFIGSYIDRLKASFDTRPTRASCARWQSWAASWSAPPSGTLPGRSSTGGRGDPGNHQAGSGRGCGRRGRDVGAVPRHAQQH